MTGRVAVISGRGSLPTLVAAKLNNPLICSLEGFDPEGISPQISFRVERIASFIAQLKAQNITHVLFAGSVHRPRLELCKLDLRSLRLLPRIFRAMYQGDDGALRAVIGYFEENAFGVVGVGDVAPELVPQAGVYAGKITRQIMRDAKRGAEIVQALGAADVGQGCVVARGLCLAAETLMGTDAMLSYVAHVFPKNLRPPSVAGLLYKAAKPQQDMRIDQPVIGVQTVQGVYEAGLDALVWQAGTVICLDMPQMITKAREYGITLWAR